MELPDRRADARTRAVNHFRLALAVPLLRPSRSSHTHTHTHSAVRYACNCNHDATPMGAQRTHTHSHWPAAARGGRTRHGPRRPRATPGAEGRVRSAQKGARGCAGAPLPPPARCHAGGWRLSKFANDAGGAFVRARVALRLRVATSRRAKLGIGARAVCVWLAGGWHTSAHKRARLACACVASSCQIGLKRHTHTARTHAHVHKHMHMHTHAGRIH